MAGMVYAWRPGTRAPLAAEVAGREFERIRQQHGESFTAASVVAAARPAKSPLHAAFEWNDTEAAEKYRQQQASHMIRHIVVIRNGEAAENACRAFLSVVEEDNDMPSYTTSERALSEEDLRNQVLSAALEELNRFERKYRRLSEFADVFSAAHKVKR